MTCLATANDAMLVANGIGASKMDVIYVLCLPIFVATTQADLDAIVTIHMIPRSFPLQQTGGSLNRGEFRAQEEQDSDRGEFAMIAAVFGRQ